MASADEKLPIYLTGKMAVCDGLRGCAILAVIFIHTSAAKLYTGVLFTWVYGWGWIGVDLFFVLSGFLITGILSESRNLRCYFRNFYARRFLRIFPLYYVLLSFVFFALPSVPVPGREQIVFQGTALAQLWYWFYVSNIGEALGVPIGNALLGITWSLCIEEQFYAAWPLFIRYFSRRAMIGAALALMVLGILLRAWLTKLGWDGLNIYLLTVTHFDGLAIGAVIALSLRDESLRPLCRICAPWMLAGGAGLFVAAGICQGSWYRALPLMQNLGFPALALAFGGLIIVAIYSDLRDGQLALVLRNRFLGLAGTLCYGLYLLHLIVIHPLRVIFVQVLKPLIPGHQVELQLLLTVTALPLCFMLAYLSWRFLESPALRFKKYFEYGKPRLLSRAEKISSPA